MVLLADRVVLQVHARHERVPFVGIRLDMQLERLICGEVQFLVQGWHYVDQAQVLSEFETDYLRGAFSYGHSFGNHREDQTLVALDHFGEACQVHDRTRVQDLCIAQEAHLQQEHSFKHFDHLFVVLQLSEDLIGQPHGPRRYRDIRLPAEWQPDLLHLELRVVLEHVRFGGSEWRLLLLAVLLVEMVVFNAGEVVLVVLLQLVLLPLEVHFPNLRLLLQRHWPPSSPRYEPPVLSVQVQGQATDMVHVGIEKRGTSV